MSKVWGVIIVGGVFYALATGRVEELSNIILSLPTDAFNLVLTLVVSASFWSGFMKILNDIGAIEKIAKLLSPILKRIMPTLNDKYALECISTNIAANVLGLGFAATPGGATFRETKVDFNEQYLARYESDVCQKNLKFYRGGLLFI